MQASSQTHVHTTAVGTIIGGFPRVQQGSDMCQLGFCFTLHGCEYKAMVSYFLLHRLIAHVMIAPDQGIDHSLATPPGELKG